MTITAFGLTDVGRKRRHNEDAYLLDVERGLFVVADGMGGHAAGEVASRITVESIQEFIAGTEEEHENTWPFGFNNRYSLEGNRLTTAVEKANEKVMRAVQNRPELKGMGTTVVAALFDANRATLVHVGDSRAYLFRNGELKRLTDDHSWVQEQVNAGILSEDEAKSHPLKNVVTRALGGAAHVAVDLIEVPIHAGDRFLLCSDGLTGMVGDDEIFARLGSPEPLEKLVRALVDEANEHGGIDNVTAILVEVDADFTANELTEPAGLRVDSSDDETAVSLHPGVPKSELPTTPGVPRHTAAPPRVAAPAAAPVPAPDPAPVPAPVSAPLPVSDTEPTPVPKEVPAKVSEPALDAPAPAIPPETGIPTPESKP